MRSAHTEGFISTLKGLAGDAQVLTEPSATRPYRTGYRYGGGDALAVVRPRSFVEQWRVLKACVEANKIMIVQAANTGLTGGSTPAANDYDREVIIISTTQLNKLYVIAAFG